MLDTLTLDQLRILIAVAEEGSFSAAARRLGRVQSGVSQAVQGLEEALDLALFDRSGRRPVLTEAGSAILAEARQVVGRANGLRAHAATIAGGDEPDLTLAVDPLFPNAVLMESLRALQRAFPLLPVTLLTEGLGGPEQRLRDGVARLAIYGLLSAAAADLHAEKLTDVLMVPVVAADHPMASQPEPVARGFVEEQTQLVLTERTPLSQRASGGIFSARLWRFIDLATRLEYLLAGFGWCHMPLHLVEPHIQAGRLKRLRLEQSAGMALGLHVVRQRGQRLGRASQWLVDDLRRRLVAIDPPAAAAGTDRRPSP
ncbi:LysR family transcriptional regulator [Labrys monachus]|uniref:DNA-binding transcriptional LysR family regulator n=1 Tax=Labrys monachus TaxID=217067 RepID=A0ABU0FQT4_9HYPH|nr:LysR family transcriptional regulator [Labrys monachus]MDQ0396464.1 DNA-binding transcriptional LysR family regulator [Labrys monachus]